MSSKLNEVNSKLSIQERDTKTVDESRKRIKEEINLLNENLRLEN